MLDPRLPHARRRAGAKTLLAGAVVLLLIGFVLTYAAFDWQQHGCRCDESLYPDWSWIVLGALAVASYVACIAVAIRAVTMKAES